MEMKKMMSDIRGRMDELIISEGIDISKALENFFDEKVIIHKHNVGNWKEKFEFLMRQLRDYLKLNHNLCDKIEYTGSVYENVYVKETTFEFDVMMIVDSTAAIQSSIIKEGFCDLQITNPMYDLPINSNQQFAPDKYRDFFKGIIKKWETKVNRVLAGEQRVHLREHGCAIMLDVWIGNSKEVSYQVDVVPCFKINSKLYVPKPIKNKADRWRVSYSIEEKEQLRNAPENCRKCVRIIKAIFKLKTEGLFKGFTSYHIKTVAFWLNKSQNDLWSQSLEKMVKTFLVAVKRFLEAKRLRHFFQEDVNLLDEDKDYQQMINRITCVLRSETKFLRLLE